jgi:pimeloyl-ACP methyl ester carboxylesterase
MENQTFWQWNLPSVSYNIYYIERGTGPHHILLIHGFAAHSYTWNKLIDDLAHAGYHVWSLDLIGFGYSDKPFEAHYGLDLFTAQIEAFMEAMHLSSACIVGNSMGGGLALAMVIFHPNRVHSLVLIDAFIFPIKLPMYFAITNMLGRFSKPFFGRMVVKRILKEVMFDPKKISEEQIEAYNLPYNMPGGREAFIRTLKNFDQKELNRLIPHFKKINIPMLIIWGEKDRWMPLSYYQRVTHTFPHAQKVLISQSGHIPQEECPQEVLEAILKFKDL